MTVPVTPHVLTDALLRLAMNEFGRWDRDGAPYADCYAAMRAVLAQALAPQTCATCKHGQERGIYGERRCDRPELVDVSYTSSYFHVPTEEFGCTLHPPAEKGPRT